MSADIAPAQADAASSPAEEWETEWDVAGSLREESVFVAPSDGGSGSMPVVQPLVLAGATLLADTSGALFWPGEGALVVADLHLEKGSSFARNGTLLPPYDTAATLATLADVVARFRPHAVIALGDSFHDGDGPARLSERDRAMLRALQRGRDWIWLAGNHDPEPTPAVGGEFAATLAVGPLVFRHQPSQAAEEAEIAGHLHPLARISRRGRAVSRRCFVGDGQRFVMPAFGTFAGGLNVRDRAFAALFGSRAFTAYLLGRRRLYPVAARQCVAD